MTYSEYFPFDWPGLNKVVCSSEGVPTVKGKKEDIQPVAPQGAGRKVKVKKVVIQSVAPQGAKKKAHIATSKAKSFVKKRKRCR